MAPPHLVCFPSGTIFLSFLSAQGASFNRKMAGALGNSAPMHDLVDKSTLLRSEICKFKPLLDERGLNLGLLHSRQEPWTIGLKGGESLPSSIQQLLVMVFL